MCNPGSGTKTDKELASLVRNHYKAYMIARDALMGRDYTVIQNTPEGDFEITRRVQI